MIEAARNRINSRSSAVLYSATGIGAAILVIGVIIVAAAKPATATPAYARKRSWLVAGATQVQPAAGHLPILARTLPRTGTNYPRNSSEISFSNSTRRRRCGNTCGRAYEHTDDSNTPALLGRSWYSQCW